MEENKILNDFFSGVLTEEYDPELDNILEKPKTVLEKEIIDNDYIEGYKDGSEMYLLAFCKYNRLGGSKRFPLFWKSRVNGKALWVLKTYIKNNLIYRSGKSQNYSLGYLTAIADRNKIMDANVNLCEIIDREIKAAYKL
jgi:hypothetical protein